MKTVRVVAVGILLAGVLMILSGIDYFRWWMNDAALNAWITAIHTLSPTSSVVASLPAVSGTVFTLLCLGAGLFISATLYSLIEDFVLVCAGSVVAIPALIAYGVVMLWKRSRGRRAFA